MLKVRMQSVSDDDVRKKTLEKPRFDQKTIVAVPAERSDCLYQEYCVGLLAPAVRRCTSAKNSECQQGDLTHSIR